MKPIPVSETQRPTCSGVMSILTPSEDSTSAAPERDDNARLPCLATGMPAPATMNEAQVDTLTEPEPSPPVPTTSTALAGAFTRSILARIAETAPVISSIVSPRTLKPISRPPICEGVASPDIMLSNAEAASSRDSVAPVATFPMIDLRSSIACFRDRAQLLAPVTCAKAASLMVVPIWLSILVTYCATASSLSARAAAFPSISSCRRKRNRRAVR